MGVRKQPGLGSAAGLAALLALLVAAGIALQGWRPGSFAGSWLGHLGSVQPPEPDIASPSELNALVDIEAASVTSVGPPQVCEHACAEAAVAPPS
jgi:hypothetical protein